MDYVNTPTNLVRFKLDKSIWELQIILSFILCFVSKQAGFYEECIKKALLSGLKNKENPMDYLQREYKCCGWNGVMDYPEEEIPESCCIGNCESENYFPGCKSVLKLFKTNYL
uniref:Tetraspanin n=1 Tax=Glossina brevipalpis TaxID=37001 RepID=A0A1A9W152_9MUSC